MKVCVYGAGAIGGYLAVGLASAPGVELSVVARGAHLEAIRSNGLKLLIGGEEKAAKVNGSARPADLGPQDYVIIGLKAHQGWETAGDLAPLFHDTTAVVTCQNGVPWWYFHKLKGPFEGKRLNSVDPDDRQWSLIGPQRVIGAVVYPATEIVAPGVIKHVYGDKFALGEPDGSSSERIFRISRAMEQGGFKAPILDDVRSEIWLKLWGNLCFNPISALTRGTLDVIATNPGTRAVARAMMAEAQTIAERLGAKMRVDIERRIDGAAKVGAHRTSMLQDLEAGKAMEIDAIVTAVQEMGRITGVATPAIDTVLALVQQLGATQGLYSYPRDYPAEAAAATA